MAPFDAIGFEVLRSEDAAPGGPLQTHNRIGDDVLRRLIEGRERITKGWCQRHLREGHSVCARGAIVLATARLWWEADSVAAQADRVLANNLPAPWQNRTDFSVVTFNNAPTTTHADVLALFDRAIASRRAELGVTP